MKTLTIILCLLFLAATAQKSREIVTIHLSSPDTIRAMDVFTIAVKFTISPSWYIYAPTGVNAAQGMIETTAVFNPPATITRVGKRSGQMRDPEFRNGHEVYQDTVTMRQIFVAGTAGRYTIPIKVTWQTCNNNICMPPMTENINAEIIVQ